MSTGNINVAVENIFPLIKKFLYSDHEIFLRELISNATDATLKIKHLTQIGEAKVEYGNPQIEVKINKTDKTLHIIDQGIGMTQEEVEKYINQIAFSGAEEFLAKYKDKAKDSGIIGHFGLGFYSAFMVARQVEIVTKSYTDAPAVRRQNRTRHGNHPAHSRRFGRIFGRKPHWRTPAEIQQIHADSD
jgi:molecular chaperone HtpG